MQVSDYIILYYIILYYIILYYIILYYIMSLETCMKLTSVKFTVENS